MSTPPEGPYLYDEGPTPLHTGTPRRRRGALVAILAGTVLVAILMVVALPLVQGTAKDQAQQVAGVFVAALAKGDTETAYGLLCDSERARLQPADVGPAYLGPGTGHVVDTRKSGSDEAVVVRWSDASTSTLTLVSQGGARVCGVHPGG
jgi:type II secretory pathway pseudopilin PulG